MMERKMKVFLSWSGDQSRAVAEALRVWLPLVLDYINPWVSSQDIKAGARWADAVAEELEGSNFGILCLTKDNLSAPWMLFEAGALSNAISARAVCPYLLDIEIRDLTGPLSQFQAKKTNKTSTRELLLAINNSASEPVPEQRLVTRVDGLWPNLETKLAEIPEAQQRTELQPRPESEILEELVRTVRAMDRRFEGLYRTGQNEEQRAQETALQAYLEQITLLVREGLREEDPLSSVRLLARVQTLNLFSQLGPKRKRTLLQMLHEAGLIGKGTPVIGLSGADLREAYLRELDLIDADLRGADMKGANLEEANLAGADLRGADLRGANLTNAYLDGVDLYDANLSNTNLIDARGLTNEGLEQQPPLSLEGATMPDGSEHP
jgi:uncharacterized protein YjbI with pentapeptide repeats